MGRARGARGEADAGEWPTGGDVGDVGGHTSHTAPAEERPESPGTAGLPVAVDAASAAAGSREATTETPRTAAAGDGSGDRLRWQAAWWGCCGRWQGTAWREGGYGRRGRGSSATPGGSTAGLGEDGGCDAAPGRGQGRAPRWEDGLGVGQSTELQLWRHLGPTGDGDHGEERRRR